MPIETSCGGCGKRLRVADEHAGKQARCPGCGHIYAVPAGAMPASPTLASQIPPSWYMKTPEGQIYGPATRELLSQWASEGRVSRDCFVRDGDRAPWQTADVIFPALGAPRTRATASSTGGGYAARPAGQHAYAAARAPGPYAGQRYATASAYRQPHRGALVLTFALLGWFACPIFAVVAWSMGSEDLNRMRLGQMDPSGQGLTQAGQILGMIQSILFLVGLAFIFLFCLIGASSGA